MCRGNDARVRRVPHQLEEPLETALPIPHRAFGFRKSRPEIVRAVRNRVERVHHDGRQRAIHRRAGLCREEKEFVALNSIAWKRNRVSDSQSAVAQAKVPASLQQLLFMALLLSRFIPGEAKFWLD
jgi:hypothetical protein